MAWLFRPGPWPPIDRLSWIAARHSWCWCWVGMWIVSAWVRCLARQLDLPLLVSGSNREYAEWMIRTSASIPTASPWIIEPRDTLGNFTSVVDELQARMVRHVLLVTSEDHLARSMAVGQVVAGSRGIQLTGVPWPVRGLHCVKDASSNGVIGFVRWRG